ncbi:MAG: EamA family transporter, partial [Deltaproteobacteria bacterium]
GFVATAIRIAASLVLLLPFGALIGNVKMPGAIFREDKRGFYLVAAGSILGPFLGISASLIAIEHTSVGIAATIMATVPILMLPLVRYLYRERLSWKAIAGACVAVAGVALLFVR